MAERGNRNGLGHQITMLRTLCVLAFVLAYLLLIGVPAVVYSAITGSSERLYRVGLTGIRIALRLAGVRMIICGRENLAADRAVVYMSNHQGNVDPPALLVTLPPIRILVKKELFRIPILGYGMRLCGFIPVNRKSREQAFAAVEEATERLMAGHSFLVFPEGTRSLDGRLLPFKKGVFMMAIRARVPIVPISISGSNKIMQKGKLVIRPGLVRITVHDPIPTAGYSVDDRERLLEQVRAAILEGLEPNEWPIPLMSQSQQGESARRRRFHDNHG
jgi:1-acyl-sn-glycerol-3-phosphate acyltransferase